MLLEVFRTHKRWLMFIAMVLVIPSFVVTGIYSYNRMVSDDGALAKVDESRFCRKISINKSVSSSITCARVWANSSAPICSKVRTRAQ